MHNEVKCLYCDTVNSAQSERCKNCAMALPAHHPHSESNLRKRFIWAFVIIVIFSIVMMIYLPR